MRNEYTTRPREQIVHVLKRERRYLSAADVFSRLKRARSQVSLSTVYRTLGLLASKGELSARVDDQGEATYVACEPTHHHHAICRACGTVEEVGCDAVESFAQALKTYHKFELEDHAMEFFGTCGKCR